MLVYGLNENESQEREQGGIMYHEIEFHLYRGHLLTLTFFKGNEAKWNSCENRNTCLLFSSPLPVLEMGSLCLLGTGGWGCLQPSRTKVIGHEMSAINGKIRSMNLGARNMYFF